MKKLINATGEQVCNAVTEFLKTNEIYMEYMNSICTDLVPSIIGKRKGFESRLIGVRSVFIIHCVLHRENFVAKNVGNHDLIAILQKAVSSVNKIRTRVLQDRLFQEACHDKTFLGRFIPQTHVGFQLVAVSRDLSFCLTKFWNFFKRETLL